MVITSNKDENLDSILEKIEFLKNKEEKVKIYTVLRIKDLHYSQVLNVSVQICHSLLWKILRDFSTLLYGKKS